MSAHRAETTPQEGARARWRDTEPVRLYLYSLMLPGAALAVVYGVATTEQATSWVAAAAAVLGVGVPAVEGVRARVTPWSPSDRR